MPHQRKEARPQRGARQERKRSWRRHASLPGLSTEAWAKVSEKDKKRRGRHPTPCPGGRVSRAPRNQKSCYQGSCGGHSHSLVLIVILKGFPKFYPRYPSPKEEIALDKCLKAHSTGIISFSLEYPRSEGAQDMEDPKHGRPWKTQDNIAQNITLAAC